MKVRAAVAVEAGKPLVMQLWSLDSSHPEVGDWCRIFAGGASPSGNNLWRASPTLSGGPLSLFAINQDLVVDQVRVFSAPSP